MNLTDEQRDLLRRFDSSGSPDTHPQSEGFFAKVRELWDDLRD